MYRRNCSGSACGVWKCSSMACKHPHIDPTPSVLAAWCRTSRLHSQRPFWYRVSAGNLWTFFTPRPSHRIWNPGSGIIWSLLFGRKSFGRFWVNMFYADKPILTDYTLLRHTLILHTSDWYQPPRLVGLTPICLRRGNPMRSGTAVRQCECFIKRAVPGLSKPVTLTFTRSGISFMRAFKICKMITFVELYTFISAACNREKTESNTIFGKHLFRHCMIVTYVCG